jgi:hypothetical protein
MPPRKTIDHADATDLSVQLAMLLRAQIKHGDLAPGALLPAERDLMARANSRSLSVTLVTIGSHELERPDLVAADPFRGFLDGVHVFHAE